ncbi:thiosulfate-binding protein SoxY [Sphaerotilus hippei]|uniref:Thiosulfate-binding protein SoxY n=1 Tax=Sphaerotilus hippei TaxID=744406 RepID=A0A318GVX2_9BURK|nr:thiosulfate oxidation carrier protein SoxY [Sphaerotilus hippei]PXW93418.1 thiosulfate-binding protein SoxY [Sphaerotilus hippei]
MPTRREMLGRSAALASLMGGLGLLPAPAQALYASAAFEAASVAGVVRALGLSAPVESPQVALQAPDIAENGAAVSLGCGTTLPGVRRLLLLVDRNPSPLCAMFEVSDRIEASFGLRAKMSQSSDVLAVAIMADDRVFYARRHVEVTLGGCGA